MPSFFVQFEPIIRKGNEGFVHHFLLYECEGNFVESDYDQGADCKDLANMPYAKCRDASLVDAWAVGGEVRSISRRRDIAQVLFFFFFVFMDQDEVEVHKHSKKR